MSPELLSLVTVSKFKELEELVGELKNHVYGTLDNKEIMEQVNSGQTKSASAQSEHVLSPSDIANLGVTRGGFAVTP
ncbi:hypothetical protein EVAR_36390_1 [Eumeta japonica]|uniref:Uncharacterized protein n=1 Tax=Eumeta variegata TaxID=151549 RepID=A0A4C1W8E8_EUMVA|nr:hypothetical protein EVAR_36390_1 [Eumeta japonica]